MRSWVPFHPLEKLWGGWNVIWIIISRIAIHSNKDKLTVLGKYNSLFCRYFLIQPVSSPLNVVRTSSEWLFPFVQMSPTTHVLYKRCKMKSRDELHSQQHLSRLQHVFHSNIYDNNFTIDVAVQQFHHLYCSTRMCHYFISLLPCMETSMTNYNCAANCSLWFHLYSIFLLDIA